MQAQATSNILMIRPVNFAFNLQTAESNAFQDTDAQALDLALTQENALKEFDAMVSRLRAIGVNVIVYEDTPTPYTPDSIFPNNWVSFHHSGKVCLYPMQAENRRLERRTDIIDDLSAKYHVETIIDLTNFEQEGKFLEGTGSLVLDRMHRIAYACISPRTNEEVLAAWEKQMNGYKIVKFGAVDANDKEIYHTNVMMCIGDSFAVICLQAIKDLDERLMVKESLESTGKNVIEITLEQMNAFAGNMLFVLNQKEHRFLVMSTKACESLTQAQKYQLSEYADILDFDLNIIETCGGGSARCMMAEVHLPER
ncbi:citrulline utilization hydrolase CtlX [Emticicia sp. TH156]|uniref:citrulline utilization hydrolase CtlX n=1 Tax=Emticicia sp. TH156 TaxID=2067454 RepID=UPI000C75BA8A|nr:arginine deiminase-related protein [Emticicia sp. TH156]PLK45100.1 amidinotransferase [Emticicia sp. TH156]